jgi:hypothetical protein
MITVDPELKKQFIKVFLMSPHSTVINAMRQANFTEENIANIKMRHYLQRALPGGPIKGMKAKILGLNPPSPDRRQRRQHTPPPNLPNDPASNAAPAKEILDLHQCKPPHHLHVDPAAMDAPPKEVVINDATVVLSLLPGTARKKCKIWNISYYKKKKKTS